VSSPGKDPFGIASRPAFRARVPRGRKLPEHTRPTPPNCCERHARTKPRSTNCRHTSKLQVTDMSSSYEDSEQRDYSSEQDEEDSGLRDKVALDEAVLALKNLRERSDALSRRLQREERKHAIAAKAERSSSPTPPKKSKKRQTTAPLGFTRSTCRLNHACSNPRCYTSLRNPQVLWDRSKYAKPYHPHRKAYKNK